MVGGSRAAPIFARPRPAIAATTQDASPGNPRGIDEVSPVATVTTRHPSVVAGVAGAALTEPYPRARRLLFGRPPPGRPAGFTAAEWRPTAPRLRGGKRRCSRWPSSRL